MTAGTAVPWSPTSHNSLVGDTGNPADWPAAQPDPPSLSGAYSKNMMRVIVTLITYEDWLGSHPNPKLVDEYMIKGSAPYKGDVSFLTTLLRRGWHTDYAPSEIDWLRVTVSPRPLPTIGGKPLMLGGHPAWEPASINMVVNQTSSPYLNGRGRAVAYSRNNGKVAYAVLLVQGADGRWRIESIRMLRPLGGLKALEK